MLQLGTAMPCYHFIFHAYGTWLPDHEDGYVERDEGQLPQDVRLGAEYRARMTDSEASFGSDQQVALVEEVHTAASKQDFRVHFVATEPTHIHVLASWKDDRPWKKIRVGLKSSLSRMLAQRFGQRPWLSEGGSRRRVYHQEHLDYLICTYLPRHGGWKWSEERGLHRD